MRPPPLPAGFGIALDPCTRVLGDGATLLGGSPQRLLRLSPKAAGLLRSWVGGARPATRPERALARRLVASGIVLPLPPRDVEPPPATIVVPVHSRPRELRRCLQAIGQAAPIIVVDDGSERPAAIADAIAAAEGVRLLRHGACEGPAAARNTGLAEAQSEVVVFIDSDCVVRGEWLRPLLAHFADPLVGAVAPRIVALPSIRGGWLHRYEAIRSPLDLGERAGLVHPRSRLPYVPAAALAVRREAAGAGFASEMQVGEDVDLIWRLHAAGWEIRYEPASSVAHEHRTRPRTWLGRRVDYGTSAAALAQRHPGQVPPAIVSPSSIALWILLLARKWGAAASALIAAAIRADAQLGPRLAPTTDVGARRRIALEVTARANFATGRQLVEATTRAWLPLTAAIAVLWPPARRPLALARCLALGAEWWRHRGRLDPLRFGLARLLDDGAYCAGVWLGCVRARSADPLWPRVAGSVSETDT